MADVLQTQPGYAARYSGLLLATIPLVARMESAAVLLGVFCFSTLLAVWGLAVAAGARSELPHFSLIRAFGDLLLLLLVLGTVGLIVFGVLQMMLPAGNT